MIPRRINTIRAISVIVLLALSTLARGAEQGTLVFAGNYNYKPLTYLEKDKAKGLFVDIVQALGKRTGRRTDIRLLVWKDAQSLLLEGRVDAIGPIGITEARKKMYDFSDPVLESQISIFIRSDKDGIWGMGDLHDLRVGVTTGGLADQLVQGFPTIRRVALGEDLYSGFRALREGRLDAVVAGQWQGQYLLAEFGITDVRTAGSPVLRLGSCLAVAKGNKELLTAINEGIRSLRADGTLERINEAWRPREIVVTTREQAMRKTVYWLIGIMVVFTPLIIGWFLTTRREISRRREVEASLRQSEARLRGLFEGSPIGTFRTTLDGRFIDCNLALAVMFGFENMEEMIGVVNPVGTPDLLWERTQDRSEMIAEVLAAKGSYCYLETRLRRKDGSAMDAEFSVSLAQDDSWPEPYSTGFVQDITLRKQAEAAIRESHQRLSFALQGGELGTWDWSIQTGEVFYSDLWLQMLGYLPEEVEPTVVFFQNLIHPGDLENVLQRLEAHVTGQAPIYESEHRLRTKSGQYKWVLDRGKVFLRGEEGRAMRAMGILTYISARKESEETLRKVNEHLEVLVDQRTLELKTAKEAAEYATQAKSAFLANMSHEIRTPMNAVIGMIFLALQTNLSDKQRDYLRKARSSADGLLALINDILDFSKIEAGKLEMERTEFLLEDVYERVIQVSAPLAAEKGMEFLLDPGPGVPAALLGDPLRLGQVLLNLCSNAIKFTGSGGTVVVKVATGPVNDEFVTLRFSVSDTGIGMSELQMQGLFQPFTQVDTSTTRRNSGTGLGLAISKRLVQLMDGEIRVGSQPGVGSEFSFSATFGLRQAQSNSGDLHTQVPTGLRILVVDDHPRARGILQGLVTHLGHEATMAASGAEALVELERTSYDLVLIDCGMPKIDGFETARRFRSTRPGSAKPKFVMVTDYGDEEQVNWAMQEGLDGHVAKPVTPASLRGALLGAFGGRPIVEPDRAIWESDIRLQGAHVLLVDDNAFNRMVAAELLELMGVVVTLAEHGQEALEFLRQDTFDAVLMDLQMPIMDGYEATRQIRSYPALKALPVLAVTAHAMVTEREKCLALGMVDYITKPIQPEVLASTLAKWVWPRARKPRPASLATADFDACSVPALNLPGISWESGMSCVGGVTSLFYKALNLFLQLNAGVAEELRLALSQGAVGRAALLTHTMVSAAGTIGAENLTALSRELEQAIQAGEELEAIEGPLLRFETELGIVLEGLRQHLPAPTLPDFSDN